MSEEPISREECLVKEKEHRDSISRIHERIDIAEKTTTSIETSAKIISESVCRMEKLMFGDLSTDGVITKISNLKQKMDSVYWLSGVVIIAVVGVLVSMIFKK